METAIETLAKLTTVRFKWKDSDLDDIGFIAEDVAKVIPEAVYYNDKNQVEGIRIFPIIALLVEAVKELNEKR